MKEVKNSESLEKLRAVPELKLMYRATPIKKVCLDSTQKIVDLLREVFSKDAFLIQEEIVLILLNGNLMPLGFMSLAKGNQNQVVYEPKSIIQSVLLSGASAFIIAHNHPDGIKYPSEADFDSCFALLRLASFFDINYVDDIILTHDDFYSMEDEGVIWQLG